MEQNEARGSKTNFTFKLAALEEVARTQLSYFTPEIFQNYYTHALKEEEKYRKMSEALDADTHVIAVENNASERAVSYSNAESSAQTYDSARTVTEGEESSS